MIALCFSSSACSSASAFSSSLFQLLHRAIASTRARGCGHQSYRATAKDSVEPIEGAPNDERESNTRQPKRLDPLDASVETLI